MLYLRILWHMSSNNYTDRIKNTEYFGDVCRWKPRYTNLKYFHMIR
jgi:hypothetical protein